MERCLDYQKSELIPRKNYFWNRTSSKFLNLSNETLREEIKPVVVESFELEYQVSSILIAFFGILIYQNTHSSSRKTGCPTECHSKSSGLSIETLIKRITTAKTGAKSVWVSRWPKTKSTLLHCSVYQNYDATTKEKKPQLGNLP